MVMGEYFTKKTTFMAMAMVVAMLHRRSCCINEELVVQNLAGMPSKSNATSQQETADTHSPQALDLPITTWESRCWRLQRPRYRCQRKEVGDKVCERMERVGN